LPPLIFAACRFRPPPAIATPPGLTLSPLLAGYFATPFDIFTYAFIVSPGRYMPLAAQILFQQRQI